MLISSLVKPMFNRQEGKDEFNYHKHTSRPTALMNKKDLILRDNANNELQEILYKDSKKIGKY